MGMGADWDRVLSYIPASRLATAEQQQRLLSMQMSMMLGVKQLQNKQRAGVSGPLSRQRVQRGAAEQEAAEEEDDVEDVSDSELQDEEGDDEEVRAMKAELRELKADKTAPTSTVARSTANTHPPPRRRQEDAEARTTEKELKAEEKEVADSESVGVTDEEEEIRAMKEELRQLRAEKAAAASRAARPAASKPAQPPPPPPLSLRAQLQQPTSLSAHKAMPDLAAVVAKLTAQAPTTAAPSMDDPD